MRLPVRFSASIVAVAVLALCAGARTEAQETTGQSSSSQSLPPQSTPDQTSLNGTYIAIDPLALVRYDNRFDISLGMAYDHMKAGPNLLQGSNLGGLDLSGTMWLSKHWGAEASGRGYLGTSGAAPNAPNNIKGPFVQEYFFTAGPEWLGPHNKHGALIAHVLVGGVDGMFEKDLLGQSPSVVGFYNNQLALAGIVGGHIDLNRSARWVFRITPDAVITRYGINYGNKITQTDVNFAISVGLEYKFKKKR
ncbi:MAG TPA: hypothetical protein VFC37_02725 [Terracidiphilus sp.]|jgi:hypothetical protein|nr:hypothetical protein [Terracidiphilus sp.]